MANMGGGGNNYVLRQLLIALGLEVDKASFAQATLAIKAVVGVAHKIADVVKDVAEFGKQTIQTAQMTGFGTDALQQWQYAADMTGVSAEQLNVGIFHLSRSMARAHEGSQKQTTAFAKLGVRVTDANGKLRGTDDVMTDLAAGFAKLPDGLDKTNLAMEVFGRSGARIIPLLDQGAEGLAKLRKEAYVMTPEQLANARELAITQMQISIVTRNLWRSAVAPLLDEINKLLKAYLEWKKANNEIMRQRITHFLHGIIEVIRFVAEGYRLLSRNADLVGYALAGLAAAFVVTHWAAIAAAVAVAEAWLAAAAPFILIGTLIAGLLMFIDDVRMYAKYGDKARTVTGQFVKELKKIEEVQIGESPWVRDARTWVGYLREVITDLHEIQDMMKGPAISRNIPNKFSPQFKRDRAPFGPMTPEQMDAAAEEEYQVKKEAGLLSTYDMFKHFFNPQPNAAAASSSPTYSPAGGGNSNYVEIKREGDTFNFTQQPWENQDEFVAKIRDVIKDQRATDNEATAAAVGN